MTGTSDYTHESRASRLVNDARAISGSWLDEMDLAPLVGRQLVTLEPDIAGIDLVAIGKAAREMVAAAESILGARVRRRFIVCDRQSADLAPDDPDVRVGEHPIPLGGSEHCARELLAFLATSRDVDGTVFLISGGASSLCALPVEPLHVGDLRGVWQAALAAGLDITTLNKIRAATSAIAGGAVLRQVRTRTSRSLIMVDNVISGAEWVASGLTYDYNPSRDDVHALVERLHLGGAPLAATLLAAFEHRTRLMASPVTTHHENSVVAEPVMVLEHAVAEAARRGYGVSNMGSRVAGDVDEVGRQWAHELERLALLDGPQCLIGVGEVTVQVRGGGRGGRCQEFAWTMADVLNGLGRDAIFVARSSDGRDFLEDVGGAWVDSSTRRRVAAAGIDWIAIKERNDTYRGLSALGQLFEGAHTGWNLCDLYVALL